MFMFYLVSVFDTSLTTFYFININLSKTCPCVDCLGLGPLASNNTVWELDVTKSRRDGTQTLPERYLFQTGDDFEVNTAAPCPSSRMTPGGVWLLTKELDKERMS